MSFFKRFTRPKTNVSLTLSKSAFILGEDLNGTITVDSKEEADINEIRIKLWCRESKEKTKTERDAKGKEKQRTYWDTATLFYNNPKLSGPFHLASGSKKEYPFTLNVPAGGRESYYSVDANVKWFIEASVDVKERRNLTSGISEVQITKPPVAPTVIKEKEIITREVVMIQCAYCHGLMPQTSTFCPNCGARRRG